MVVLAVCSNRCQKCVERENRAKRNFRPIWARARTTITHVCSLLCPLNIIPIHHLFFWVVNVRPGSYVAFRPNLIHWIYIRVCRSADKCYKGLDTWCYWWPPCAYSFLIVDSFFHENIYHIWSQTNISPETPRNYLQRLRNYPIWRTTRSPWRHLG